MKEENVYSEVPGTKPAPVFLRRVSWGAILAGLVVALVLQIVLSVLGVAIGASTVGPLRDVQPAKGLAIGSVIWFGLSSILSIFAGACVAGRLSGGPRQADGLLHGIATWATATLLSVLLLTTAAGNILGGTARLLGSAMLTGMKAASSASNSEGGFDWQGINQEAVNMLPQAGGGLPPTGRNDQGQDQSQTSLPAQAKQNPELGAILGRMFSRGAAAADPQDREAAINLLASQGMNREQAASTIDQWDREYQQKSAQGEQRVRQVGATAVRGVAAAAWWSFAFLVLSAGAAAWGGWIGTRGLLYVRPEAPAAAI